MSKKRQQLMVKGYEKLKKNPVEKMSKLADCNVHTHKCCNIIRSTKTRIETSAKHSGQFVAIQQHYKIHQNKD